MTNKETSVEQLAAEIQQLRKQMQDLLDREAIRECLARYCRGIDRLDTEMALSTYHPDAIDDHCMFVGEPGPLVEWANQQHLSRSRIHQHIITTHNCELDGDVAHTETYWMAANMLKDGSPATLVGGRYIDRFEKRDGVWKVAARKVLYDWNAGRRYAEAGQQAIDTHGRGSRDKSDPSYQRPFTVDPARVGFKVTAT